MKTRFYIVLVFFLNETGSRAGARNCSADDVCESKNTERVRILNFSVKHQSGTDLAGSLERDGVVSLDRRDSAQLHVEEEEDEAVESRAQAVTQAPDARDHSLH